MKRRGSLLVGLGALAIVLALMMFSHESSVCPAVRYANLADVELVFSPRAEVGCGLLR